jgi:hypothetical protein
MYLPGSFKLGGDLSSELSILFTDVETEASEGEVSFS